MDFSGSDLTDAIFDGADLHLAIFDKCRISNTHFEASKVLTQEQINMAGCSDEDVPPYLARRVVSATAANITDKKVG